MRAQKISAVEKLLKWSTWQLLQGCWRGALIPTAPGLYRVRRANHSDIDYIGQTGAGQMTLKRRIGMLRGVFADNMPFRDPHTAAPAFWALRHQQQCEFEVSFVPIVGSTQWRKGLEALAISLYRRDYGKSPTVNFGRMPAGYKRSSGNNLKLASSKRRFRGGLTLEEDSSHHAGIAPVGPLTGDVKSLNWCGHHWSEWLPIKSAIEIISSTSVGLYRIGNRNNSALLYVGQGRIRSRLIAHYFKAQHQTGEQGRIFGSSSSLYCSWVINNSWLMHERLELENDLIAGHLLYTHKIPAAQLLGLSYGN